MYGEIMGSSSGHLKRTTRRLLRQAQSCDRVAIFIRVHQAFQQAAMMANSTPHVMKNPIIDTSLAD